MSARGKAWSVTAVGLLAAGLAVDMVGSAAGADGAVVPQRIVSLNLCTDQLVVALAPRAHIAAVTVLATDAQSTPEPELGAGLPLTTADAEDVIGLRPDLILASPFTPAATMDLLRRTGHRIEVIGAAQTIAGVKDAITKAASAMGDPLRGAVLIAGIDAAIARNAARDAARPSAIVMQPNSYVSGSGSLVSELLAVTGFRNHAEQLGVREGGRVDTEALIVRPPDVLVLASAPDEYATVAADNLRHPALAALAQRVPHAVVPWNGWLCGTHHIVRVLDELGALRRRMMAGAGRHG